MVARTGAAAVTVYLDHQHGKTSLSVTPAPSHRFVDVLPALALVEADVDRQLPGVSTLAHVALHSRAVSECEGQP